MADQSELDQCTELAGRFLQAMKSRTITSINDKALQYHLALLLRSEGHPTIRKVKAMRGEPIGVTEHGEKVYAIEDEKHCQYCGKPEWRTTRDGVVLCNEVRCVNAYLET